MTGVGPPSKPERVTEPAPARDVLADEMYAEALRDGQSARRVEDEDVDAVRSRLRERGRADGVRLRTARLGGTVVVARLDAELWRDDRATMRSKLTPPA